MSVLVGKPAPDFTAQAVVKSDIKSLTLSSYRGQYVVLFFYPLDFTFVCPTELIAFDDSLSEFKSRNTAVIGCSVDSHFSHLQWNNMSRRDGGLGGVEYPLVADLTKSIARDYDVLTGDGAVAYRGLFLIDKEGVVRHQVVNDLPLGRSIDEALRMVDSLQFFEQNGEACPANWKKGAKSIKPDPKGAKEYFTSVNK